MRLDVFDCFSDVPICVNSVDDKRTPTNVLTATIVQVNFNGEILWSTPALFKTSCRLIVDKYPFDVQVG